MDTYEKKYNEALERAKQKIDAGFLTEDDLSYIFPELRESEDEMSRKWILELLYDGLQKTDPQFKVQFKAAIAYLEKQKELPFVKDVMLGYPGLYFYDGERMHFRGPAMEEKQKEQKPAEWSEEDKDYYDTIVRKLEVIGDDSGLSNNQIKFLREHCPSLRPQPYWKPSEEQEEQEYYQHFDPDC